MTAWLAVVAPMCLTAKCCVDFIVLEYGSKFQFITDEQLLIGGAALCGYALLVDLVNLARGKR